MSEHLPVSSVLVCRGCCCGTDGKHPDTDHDLHLDRIRAVGSEAKAKVFTVGCLGPCERSNVVVVRSGSQRRWFGELLTDDQLAHFTGWLATGGTQPITDSLAQHRFDGPRPQMARSMLGLRGDALTERVVEALRAGGAWTMGVVGAIAEFDPLDAEPAVEAERSGDTTIVRASTEGAAIQLMLDSEVRCFRFDDPDKPYSPSPHLLASVLGDPPLRNPGVTALGPDIAALTPDDAGELFDLGLDRDMARFMVRTGDQMLQNTLRSVSGTPLESLAPDVMEAIAAVSPTRVVETSLGRIEVSVPIPPPDGESPVGSHTHLLSQSLLLGLDLPEGWSVPTGWHVGPLYYPEFDPSQTKAT